MLILTGISRLFIKKNKFTSIPEAQPIFGDSQSSASREEYKINFVFLKRKIQAKQAK